MESTLDGWLNDSVDLGNNCVRRTSDGTIAEGMFTRSELLRQSIVPAIRSHSQLQDGGVRQMLIGLF